MNVSKRVIMGGGLGIVVSMCVVIGQSWEAESNRKRALKEGIVEANARLEMEAMLYGKPVKGMRKPWSSELAADMLEVRQAYTEETRRLRTLLKDASPAEREIIHEILNEQMSLYKEEIKRINFARHPKPQQPKEATRRIQE